MSLSMGPPLAFGASNRRGGRFATPLELPHRRGGRFATPLELPDHRGGRFASPLELPRGRAALHARPNSIHRAQPGRATRLVVHDMKPVQVSRAWGALRSNGRKSRHINVELRRLPIPSIARWTYGSFSSSPDSARNSARRRRSSGASTSPSHEAMASGSVNRRRSGWAASRIRRVN